MSLQASVTHEMRGSVDSITLVLSGYRHAVMLLSPEEAREAIAELEAALAFIKKVTS